MNVIVKSRTRAAALATYARAFALILYSHLQSYTYRAGLTVGSNTITNLIPTLYEALDIVSRELVGFIPAVSRNSNLERVALNQTVNVPIVPAIVGGNVTPGATPASDGDATIGNTTMTISKSRYWPVRWNGEEMLSVSNSGMSGNVMRDQFAQAFRAACNEVEADLAALHIYASRAVGVYNAVPFATNAVFTDFANVLRALDENGAPPGDRQLVLGSAAIANLRGVQSLLFKANEAGTSDLLRNGILGRVEGLDIHNSAQVKRSVTIGTSNNAGTTNTAGYAVGATTITLASAGTGTIIAGDIITFTGDTNQYIVVTGDSDTSNGGTIVLADPGLKKALATSAITITVVAAADRNMAFAKSAIQLATRAPALPIINGKPQDMADDRTTVIDPVSGLAFEVSMYLQYRQVKYEVALAWGVKAVKPEHIVLLLGTAS